MNIKELATPAEFAAIFPLIQQLTPNLTQAEFRRQLKVMRARGYRCIAAYEGKKIVGISGFWLITRFWSGQYLEPDNVVVDRTIRGRGVGSGLMRWLEQEAERLKCNIVKLDSYATNHASHRFYHREGYAILGYVFVKKLKTANRLSAHITINAAEKPAVAKPRKRAKA